MDLMVLELMVKGELCQMVVDARMVSDVVMTILLVCEEDVLGLICGYPPQSGRSLEEDQFFMMT